MSQMPDSDRPPKRMQKALAAVTPICDALKGLDPTTQIMILVSVLRSRVETVPDQIHPQLCNAIRGICYLIESGPGDDDDAG